MKYLLAIILQIGAAYTLAAQQKPQEPTKPYPYISEDITFQNKEANITLAGTLTLPKNETDFPVVILISGSSPHNRNEEIAGHKPFMVIADYLTSNGIGVLRYDDRGVGQSEGTYKMAAYADRTSDVKSAIAYVKSRKEINNEKIGLLGHSEGGLIAARAAAEVNDVGFMVLLASPGLPGYDLILLQTEITNKAKGVSDTNTQRELAFLKGIFDVVVEADDLNQAKADLSDSFESNPERLPEGINTEIADRIIETFTAQWFQNVLRYDPGVSLEKVKCPVLALNAEKDLQIPPKENLAAIKTALEKGGNNNVTVKALPGLNHLFQEAETGLQEEFSRIEQTISPVALEEIKNWILFVN